MDANELFAAFTNSGRRMHLTTSTDNAGRTLCGRTLHFMHEANDVDIDRADCPRCNAIRAER